MHRNDGLFRENSIKQWPQLEDVPKTTILKALRHATANCATIHQGQGLIEVVGGN